MKKKKAALAIGLCLAVGLCGASLVACGGDDNKKPNVVAGEKSEYYLAGSAKSGLFENTPLGTWNDKGHASTKDQIPDSIALKTTTNKNEYSITLDLYEGDEFQILIAGDDNNGWGGQMGAEILTPEPLDTDPFGGKPSGGKNSNIYARQDGNYTLTLKVDAKKGNTCTYVRNGNAAPLPTQYNYWVMGEKVSGGKAMYNGMTSFKTDSAMTEYTVTLNLDANEKISILAADESAGNNGANITDATLEAGAAITEIPAAAEEPAGPVYQYQAGEAGSYTITIAETDTVDTATNKVNTTRKINATKAEAVAYDFYLRSDINGDDLMEKNEYKFVLNNENGKYEYTFTAAEKLDSAPDDQDGWLVGKMYEIDVVKAGDSALVSGKIVYKLDESFHASWAQLTAGINHTSGKILEAGSYTISIDPASFEVTVTKEGETLPGYTVYAHGSYNGAGWADNTVSGRVVDGTATLTLTLKNGDEFGFRTFHASNHGKKGDQLAWGGSTAESLIDEKIGKVGDTIGSNFKVLADGTYTFTVTVGADGKITGITAVEAAA